MAKVTDRPDLSVTMPHMSASGRALIVSYTQATIWAETKLQIYFTSDEAHDTMGFVDLLGPFVDDYVLKPQTLSAFRMIDAVSALDFNVTKDYAKADIVVAGTSKSNTGVHGVSALMGESKLEVAINQGTEPMASSPEMAGDGNYAGNVILHEMGHSFGLLHSHLGNSPNVPLPEFGVHLNSEIYTVASYTSPSPSFAYGHAVSLMALDIAAVQALYGAEKYAVEDSRYTLSDPGTAALDLAEGNTTIGRAYYCIWDTGGTDTIDYGGNSSVLINLNDATLDTSGVGKDLKSMIVQLSRTAYFDTLTQGLKDEITDEWHHAGGFFSRVLEDTDGLRDGIDGGFSIARGTRIDKATGGRADDLLIGNEGGNWLGGGGGGDTLIGAAGNDRLSGGGGTDWLDGGWGSDTLLGGGDVDRFVFARGYGKDTIVDLEAGDVIDLGGLSAIESYSDLKRNHMTQADGDVVITAGKDVLVIEDVAKADLVKDTFLI